MKVDLAKRRRVMERSRRLGHCICDVRRTCPCDVLREQDLCPCAGERPDPSALPDVRLMQWVRNAGCASKIAPADLDAVLTRLPEVKDPAIISGLAAADDAAIYRISDDLCLVQTVDVFTPCVEDPRLFGKICAANCLSDIYAMGGEPRTALSVLAFPVEQLPGEVILQMLAGAMETFQEAGVALVGGHSVKDDEIKLGFAITGVIDPAAALEKPQAGDALVLTKPLGTGVLTFGQQIGEGHTAGLAAAQEAMATLNKAAAEAMREAGASAGTDVTGFGLFAHLLRMLRPSGLGAEVFAADLPAFEGAVEAFRRGVIPGAVERNREYVGEALEVEPGVDESLVNLGLDAQTSGGLLIAIPMERLDTLRRSLLRRGAGAFVIGRITDRAAGRLHVKPHHAAGAGAPTTPERQRTDSMNTSSRDATGHDGCCADIFENQPGDGRAAEAQKAFGEMLSAVQAGGALSEKVKELILFSLILQSRCHPCFQAHYRRARALGITPSELDEAAWCAIAMGGAPVKAFYQTCLEGLAERTDRPA
jgi:selenide,water dikinase